MNAKKKLYFIFSVIVILAMTIPYMIASSYSILATDDFSYALVNLQSTNVINLLIESIRKSFQTYVTWQGTYFSVFLLRLLNPANSLEMPWLQIVMVINCLLLYFSLLYFLHIMFKYTETKGRITCFITIMFLFSLLNFEFYQEIFFWFTGACVYGFPFSLLLIGLSAFINYNNSNKVWHLTVALICGFCAMGGNLSITGTGCYILLLICGYFLLKCRKFSLSNIFILAFWILCALANALAPGNFERHGNSDSSGLHPHMALRISLENIDSRLDYLTENTVFVAILLLFFVCGLLIGRRQYNHIKEYLIISFLALFTPIVTCFPVALGYSSNYFPNRCVFVLDWTLILTISNFVIAIGCFVTSRLKFEHLSEISVVLSVVAVCFILSDYEAVANSPTVEVSKQLCDGTYSNYYAQYLNVLDELSSYPQGSDVVIYSYKLPYDIPYYFNFYLMEDSSNWVNADMANYFGYNSITVSNKIP